MQLKLILIATFFLYSSCFVTVENVGPPSPPSCGCCPSPRCNQPISCSSNVDCECLLMTMTGAGMCANTVISCAALTRCESDNQTCSIPNTICVNNTRCNVPVCYPIAQATPQICPPVTSQNISTILPTTATTPSTTTALTSTTASTTTPLAATTPSTTTASLTTMPSTSTALPTTTPSTTTASPTTTATIMTTISPNACSNGTRCLNNGTCQPSGSSFFCLCRSSNYGVYCQFNGTTDFGVVDRIINGSNVTYERTVENVLNRNNWTDIVAVVDVTGSMIPCAAAVYKWITLAYERVNRIKYYVFFNDGDNKPQNEKVIGSTGAIYGIPTTDLNTVLNTMKTAMRNGDGGDIPENDIEAILFGIKQCPNCSNVIHIADNQATPRDLILLKNVTKPVKVIVCQLNGSPLNINLLNIAATTNGSIHTLEQDIINLSGIPIDGTITIGTRIYKKTITGYVLV